MSTETSPSTPLPARFFTGSRSVIESLDLAYQAALKLSAGKVSWPELSEDVRHDISEFNRWATRNMPWEDWEAARRNDAALHRQESIFFNPLPNTGLDLSAEVPSKFAGPVTWVEDHVPSQDTFTLNHCQFKILDSGLQVLGDQGQVKPHTENTGVTELIFPVWSLEYNFFHPFARTQYHMEDDPKPQFVMAVVGGINRLVGSQYALRVKNGTSLFLEVYEPGYDLPRIAISPIPLTAGKKHWAESQTQTLYFALKVKEVDNQGQLT